MWTRRYESTPLKPASLIAAGDEIMLGSKKIRSTTAVGPSRSQIRLGRSTMITVAVKAAMIAIDSAIKPCCNQPAFSSATNL